MYRSYAVTYAESSASKVHVLYARTAPIYAGVHPPEQRRGASYQVFAYACRDPEARTQANAGI
eukprot:1802553-Rhodomonas_salina.3